MTALAKDRIAPNREGLEFVHPVAAAAVIHSGALVVLNATGFAAPATAAAQLVVAGVAQEAVDNTGGIDGAKTVRVRKGSFKFANGDAIDQADVGELAWAADDQTVAKAAAGKSPVGIITEVESDGVWVWIPPRLPADAANPDTASGVVATVETEVNELKATMRRWGMVSS